MLTFDEALKIASSELGVQFENYGRGDEEYFYVFRKRDPNKVFMYGECSCVAVDKTSGEVLPCFSYPTKERNWFDAPERYGEEPTSSNSAPIIPDDKVVFITVN